MYTGAQFLQWILLIMSNFSSSILTLQHARMFLNVTRGFTALHILYTFKTRSIWKMLGPFTTASHLTPIQQMSLAILSRTACASMSTTTTTRDRWDRYGPTEWAQLWYKLHVILQHSNVTIPLFFTVSLLWLVFFVLFRSCLAMHVHHYLTGTPHRWTQ